MRISDWSSDVCSSDLGVPLGSPLTVAPPPSLPLPSQGEAPRQALATEGAPASSRPRARPGYSPLSKTRSASSAAMQPNPAEVNPCPYRSSATSTASNMPVNEVLVAPPPRNDRNTKKQQLNP